MTSDSADNDLKKLAKALLSDEDFISALARKLAAELSGAARGQPDPVRLWAAELDALEGQKAEECTPEHLAKLFPLSPDEIKRVGTRLRTGALKGALTLETLREQVLAQIGDDVLMSRAGAKGGRGARCSDEYQCGYPYHCGHEVACSTSYEAIPCPGLYQYFCRPRYQCEPEYWLSGNTLVGAPPQARGKRCADEYQCGYPYHCGHEVQCSTPYEFLPCGPLHHYACRPRKDCPPIYWNSGGA